MIEYARPNITKKLATGSVTTDAMAADSDTMFSIPPKSQGKHCSVATASIIDSAVTSSKIMANDPGSVFVPSSCRNTKKACQCVLILDGTIVKADLAAGSVDNTILADDAVA